jgi:orotidine-5'-phosphate decarboxylase
MLCIGLDPEPAALPDGLHGANGIVRFCQEIVEATADLVCAYKPNLAFFERLGPPGWEALERVIAAIPPHLPVIADAKRGDIGNTSRAYAEALFGALGAHACTVSPYLGMEAVAPFLAWEDGFSFILCRTSNPGAGALQDLDAGGEPLYARVIRLFSPWLAQQRAGLVIGAQEAAAFGWAARLAPDATVLVPGIGAQGGSVATLATALSPEQAAHVVVSVSRGIIHAGRGRDFAQAARAAAIGYRDTLRAELAKVGSSRATI